MRLVVRVRVALEGTGTAAFEGGDQRVVRARVVVGVHVDDRHGAGSCPSVAYSDGVADRQDWLGCYFDDNYLWYRLSPQPSPSSFATVEDYFDALLYRGGDPIPNGGGALWPADRYSSFQSTESFNRFFGDGQTLGYGVAVNGLEAVAQGASSLFVRYVEPLSPAARTTSIANGLQRGDEIIAVNLTPAATIIAADDFGMLTPNVAGDQLRLDVRRGTGPVTSVILSAAIFTLTPVQSGQVVQSPNGLLMGYVFVKDMISQVGSPLATTMSSFRNQGIQELVLDLRYNGGGLVSMGTTVASYAGGSAQAGKVYTSLLYNDKQSRSNQTYLFSNPGAWSGFSRVYVLMGERTCSASEQVVNGLRGVGVDVVAIGNVTCGKPVGFLPRDNACGTTYNVVNFEGVNARNEGRYFDGLAPTCPVAEDFTKPTANPDDPLLVSAAAHADTGSCPILAGRELPQARSVTQRARYNGADGAERTGMAVR